MAYCAWLSERTGQQYRLPTEAEWEKAASWDSQTNKKRLYPWGDEWNADLCNNKESGPGSTVLVVGYTAYRTGEMTARSIPSVVRDPAYWITVFPWALMVAFWLWAFMKLREFRKTGKNRRERGA